MIRCYSDEDERRVRMRGRVRDWGRVGLISEIQVAQLDARLEVDLKRTNTWLRAVLGFFTIIVAMAVMGLAGELVGAVDATEWALVEWLVSLSCFVLADYLAGSTRLYRYGVEEMLAVSAVLLSALGAYSIAHSSTLSRVGSEADTIAALTMLAAGGATLYLRFGFVYAAAGAIISAGLIPFQFGWPEVGARTGGTMAFAAMFAAIHTMKRRHGDEFPGDDYASIQTAPLAGVYFALNLRVTDLVGAPAIETFPAWFYWSTYAATWLIPITTLAAGVKSKDRPLLTLGVALLLGTLATNKPYLGMVRETWDPMVLGVLLVAAAIGFRRWLASGVGGQRNGYVATPILVRDRELLTTLANASVLWHAEATAPPAADAGASGFQGGRSGGGGGGASY